jgi:hypothetical protein
VRYFVGALALFIGADAPLDGFFTGGSFRSHAAFRGFSILVSQPHIS